MVEHGVLIGHVVSSRGLEVERDKIDIIQSLPYPKCVKEVRTFLGHVGFYRKFIKDFSKIVSPLCALLTKGALFDFNADCRRAFDKLKSKLTTTPIVQALIRLPFELMCNASDMVVGAVLNQRVGMISHVIYYASRTLNVA